MIDSTSAPSALTPLSLSPDRRTGAVTRSVLRILVVDDDEASRRALDQLLRKAGYDVHVRESGAAALALLELEQFAVMLCDDEMPGMSGLQLVQRALRLDPDLAVLLLGGVNEARAATSCAGR
jgi:CheY-like chemotaxis protein